MSEPSPADVLAAVRDRAPLVHCLTAAVTMNTVADALLAAGARPMMTETDQEAPVVVTRAHALLINLGTLSTDGAAGIPPTVAAARSRGLPWVLDPAAVGVAPVRTRIAADLLRESPAVIRCNASEALVLSGLGSGGSGPDSTARSEEAAEAAIRLARSCDTVVAVSGEVDLITDGHRIVRLDRGTPTLTRVTGTGCSLGALTAACCAVADPWTAAITATLWVTIAAERAEGVAAGPGSFKIAWLDALSALEPQALDPAPHEAAIQPDTEPANRPADEG